MYSTEYCRILHARDTRASSDARRRPQTDTRTGWPPGLMAQAQHPQAALRRTSEACGTSDARGPRDSLPHAEGPAPCSVHLQVLHTSREWRRLANRNSSLLVSSIIRSSHAASAFTDHTVCGSFTAPHRSTPAGPPLGTHAHATAGRWPRLAQSHSAPIQSCMHKLEQIKPQPDTETRRRGSSHDRGSAFPAFAASLSKVHLCNPTTTAAIIID